MHKRASITAVIFLLFLTLALRARGEDAPNLSRRAVVHRVQPIYPEIARRTNLEGLVMIRADVAADGHVRSVNVVSGNAILAQAVIGAVREWIFVPGAEEQIAVSIRFNDQQ